MTRADTDVLVVDSPVAARWRDWCGARSVEPAWRTRRVRWSWHARDPSQQLLIGG